MLTTGKRRTVIGVLVSLLLAMAVVASLGNELTFLHDRVAGEAVAVVEDVPGPETGPVCPLDARYVDEEPDGLPPEVLSAFQRLRSDAGAQGVELCLNDGKRSVAQQEREFADAVERFGTEELAAQYVLPPDESMHVQGTAIDVQPLRSAAWVETNGGTLGWCRRYENEPWHFEYSPDYRDTGCPALLPSATS